MSRLLDDDQDELQQRERELTLSTGAILAIFLGLVLLCGVFFGFGYNLGRKATATSNAALPAATSETEPSDATNSTFDSFKPSPSSRSTPPSPTSATPDSTAAKSEPAPAATAESAKETQPAAPAVHVPTPASSTNVPRAVPVAALNTPAAPSSPGSARSAQPAAPTVAPGGAFVVQIAAISATHKDDADLLANALHSKGYAVTKRTDTQDKLIHVQVGPFATKADAEAMRERLIVDGYNPIVK
jgi:DedD protein